MIVFYGKKFVPGILHHNLKTELKLVEALLRKSQKTLSVSKQANKQTSKQANKQSSIHKISITRPRRDFGFSLFDLCRPIDELIRFWAWQEQPLLQKKQKTFVYIQNFKIKDFYDFFWKIFSFV